MQRNWELTYVGEIIYKETNKAINKINPDLLLVINQYKLILLVMVMIMVVFPLNNAVAFLYV